MDVVRLRICTWKSIIDFGQFAGMSVHQIYSLNHTNYLRWIYYNCAKISFTEEILKEIKVITDKCDRRIEKPGTNPEIHEEANKHFFSALVNKKGNAMRAINTIKFGSRIKVRRGNYRQYKEMNKAQLQAKNQGHF